MTNKEIGYMNMDERIRRINELYHKSQAEGLTEDEKAEQARLRREYVDSVKNNLKAQLDNINIQQEDGTIENLGKKYGNRK
jgi:5-formyltetrahydrofolate cyclo-ligase